MRTRNLKLFSPSHPSPAIQIQPKNNDSRIRDLGNKIFFEFNPRKRVPCPLPHDYHLNRITYPPVYVRLITSSPDLQQHLIQKIIMLVNSMLEQCQTLRSLRVETESTIQQIQQEAENFKQTAANLSRQIEIDLSRPPGFELVTGETFKSIIEEALIWKEEVLAWIEATQQANLKAKQTQTTIFATTSKKNWSKSVSDAADKLLQAVAQREADLSQPQYS